MSEEFEFTQVGGSKKYFKYKECNEGDVLVPKGEYIGSGTDKFGNPNHDFRDLDSGEITCLNSAGGLNKTIEQNIAEGDICRIIYKGMMTLEKGPMAGKDCHTFEVLKSKGTKLSTADASKAKAKKSKVSLDDLE